MSGYDGPEIFYADQNQAGINPMMLNPLQAMTEGLSRFKKFLREWQIDKSYVYRDQIKDNVANNTYILEVDFDDINNFDTILSHQLHSKPAEFHPIFEKAVKEFYASLVNIPLERVPEFQVQVFSSEKPKPLRDLKSTLLNQLVTVSGIIVNANKSQIKGRRITVRCKNCSHKKIIEVQPGLSTLSIPRMCEANKENAALRNEEGDKCPVDPYVIIPEESFLVDQQTLKLQENPETVPTGEIPRTFQICVDRALVNKIAPGTRVTVTGIYSVLETKVISTKTNTASLKIPYILVLGYKPETTSGRGFNKLFTLEEEEKIRTLSKDPEIYEKISRSIASAIYGSQDIKKALSLLLFGGSRKVLPDKTKLRGDINILLIGDPSTAKSQFLKFIERVAPIAIYTSGKGSSAAGLTASILKDFQTGEFQLEGGAMVLADGGIVCIDEFDKMRPQDRIAIHEAMEQQTISVAKAGITTILNSRTSVLAAANPIFGRYDDMKVISDQIDLQTTILSRFDCIFIVRDIRSAEHDKTLANHILNLHMGGGNNMMEIEETDIDLNFLKKYIYYARSKISPRLTEDAAKALQNLYVDDRKKVQEAKQTKKSHIPITVRQLEAIIRLSEARAKLCLSNHVSIEHVDEAHRLFQVSTLNAISSGLDVGLNIPAEISSLVLKIEDSIKRRVAIGSKINYDKLVEELSVRFNNLKAVEMSIVNLIKNDEFQQIEGKKVLVRKK